MCPYKHFLRCENKTAIATIDKTKRKKNCAKRKGDAMEYLAFLASMLVTCIFLMAFALIYSPKAEVMTEVEPEATPGMDKQKECCELGDVSRKTPNAYIVCEIKMNYETEIVGVFSTQREADKYCEYMGIVGGDSFFYVEEHALDKKHIPSKIGVEFITSDPDMIVDFFDLEKRVDMPEYNENVVRGTISYSGESIEKLRRMARFMKDAVVK